MNGDDLTPRIENRRTTGGAKLQIRIVELILEQMYLFSA
jgi:hypothetical protein